MYEQIFILIFKKRKAAESVKERELLWDKMSLNVVYLFNRTNVLQLKRVEWYRSQNVFSLR